MQSGRIPNSECKGYRIGISLSRRRSFGSPRNLSSPTLERKDCVRGRGTLDWDQSNGNKWDQTSRRGIRDKRSMIRYQRVESGNRARIDHHGSLHQESGR